MSQPSYRFPSRIATNFHGFQALCDFYTQASQHRNCWFTLDWESLEFFEANLSALLLAMTHKLKIENELEFFLDPAYLKGPMNIFWRNGLAFYIYKKSGKPDDIKKTTIPVRAFRIDDVDKFANYIEQDLLEHQGVDNLRFHDRQRVKDSYFEIFSNVHLHAQTTYPVLACGQFFPNLNEVKFSLVDMGVGFLHNIRAFTQNTSNPVLVPEKAIKWALDGNSTKIDAAGGTGLKRILSYCFKNNGSLHIVTDGCYWAYDNGQINTWKLKNYFAGTTISLIFRSH